MYCFFAFIALLQAIVAIPVPRLVTRLHTADAITTTQTYTTGTTTIWLPPVEILISNGITYTSTNYNGQWATTQAMHTSVIVEAVMPVGSATPAVEALSETTAETNTLTTRAESIAAAKSTPALTTTQAAETIPKQTAETMADQNAETNKANMSQSTEITDTPAKSTETMGTPAKSTANAETETTERTKANETIQPAQATQTTEATSAETTTDGTTQQETTNDMAGPESPTTSSATSAAHTTPQETTKDTTTQAGPKTTRTKTTATSTTAAARATSVAPGYIKAPSVIVYSPYASDGSCKGYDAIKTDLQLIQSKGISKIRLYGADCAVTTAVLPLCMELGITVNQGFWISSAGVNSIDGYVSSVVEWAKTKGWSVFDFFTVGNEAILESYCTVSELIDKIASVKQILNNAGYSGKVTTSEPPVSFINNPSLCTDSVIDFVGVNPHSYFNANLYAYQAGEYITAQQKQVAAICSKEAFITETGYPHKGDVYGNNVPSDENQYIALASIMEYTGGDVTILTAFDDMWKTPGTHNIEKYFGMINLIQS